MALVKVQKTIFEDSAGTAPAGGAVCSVFFADSGMLANLYTTRSGVTSQPNPITTGADGLLSFYVEAGRYDIDVVHASGSQSYDDYLAVSEVVVSGPAPTAEFETVENMVLGLTTSGTTIDYSKYEKLGMKTTYNNLTSKAGSGDYIKKTVAQAATDGDVIDGTGAPNYSGANHALTGGTHVAILSGVEFRTTQMGVANDVNVQFSVDNSDSSETVFIDGAAEYTAAPIWKGRRHETSDLPHVVNSFAKTNGQLGARMWVDGNVLYDCTYVTNHVNAYSLANPRNPSHIASYDVGSNPRHVTVSGRYMFVVSNGSDKLQIYEIDSVLAAGLIGEITVGAEPKMCIVDGNVIHVVCGASNTLEKYSYSILDGVATIELVATASTMTTPLCVASNGAGILAVCGLSDGTITLVGERNYNVITNTNIGGGAKSTLEFIDKTTLLVASPGDARVYSVNIKTLAPVVTGFTDTVDSPEQLIIAPPRAYVPDLTNPGIASALSCIDITNAGTPFEYKQIPLTIAGGGFGAYYDDGETGYIYVNGHFSPYNIEVIEVPRTKRSANPLNRSYRTASDYANFGRSHSESLNGGIGELVNPIRTLTSNANLETTDVAVRLGLGASLALFDPSLTQGREYKILNVHAASTSDITNAFAGFSGTLGAGSSVVLLSDGSQWDVVASHGTIT